MNALLIFLFSFFCSANEPIRIQLQTEPYSLDPLKARDQTGYSICENVNEGLFRIDHEGKLQNGLVKSYKISKDRLVYTFKLREDAKWSDGKPVTVQDFIFSLRRALTPASGTYDPDLLYSIKNAKWVFEGKMPPEKLGVSEVNGELKIELDSPDESLLFQLALPLASPSRGEWSWQAPATGPYMIKSYKVGEIIELVPNPNHYKPGLHPVVYRVISEDVAAMNLFEAGGLDIISTVTQTQIPLLQKKGLLVNPPGTTVMYLSFNTSAPPFNDVLWRKAVAASIKQEELAGVLQGSFRAAKSYIPEALDGYKPFNLRQKSRAERDKVKALKEKPRITLSYGTSPVAALILQKVQNDISQGLDAQVELNSMEFATFLGRLESKPPPLFYVGMGAPFNTPQMHFKSFISKGWINGNRSRWKNAEYDELFEKIRVTPRGPKRTKLIERAQTILVEEEAVVIPLLERLQVYGVSKAVKGFNENPHNVIRLELLRK